MRFDEVTQDFMSGVTAAMKAHRLGTLKEIDEYHLSLTFFLSYVTKRLEMDTDEGNIAVKKCMYELGFETDEMPAYLEERK